MLYSGFANYWFPFFAARFSSCPSKPFSPGNFFMPMTGDRWKTGATSLPISPTLAAMTGPLFRLVPYAKAAGRAEKIPIWGLLLLFLPVWLMYYLGNFGGFSLGKALALYVIGFYLLSGDRVMETVERHLKWLAPFCGMGTALSVWLYDRFSYYGDLWVNFIGWVSILTLLALARKLLNRKWSFTAYMNRASYPIYILHQSILVAWAYVAVRLWDSFCMQVLCICGGSFVLTALAYQIVKRIPVVRAAVGIYAPIQRKAG